MFFIGRRFLKKKMKRLLTLAVLTFTHLAHAAPPEWVYVENGTLKLGVRKDAGACVGFLAGADGRNVLNSFDHGRFVQQSFYGDSDGSMWGDKPWRYNPVQGGDYHGHAATVLEFKAEGSKLYAKTQPRQWASGADVPEMVMEEWITLEADAAHIHYKMTYTGQQSHKERDHEIPAIFVEPEFDTMALYDGTAPWTDAPLTRRQPGFPNESAKLTENWAAWVDAKNWGLGAYVPATTHATCYRYRGGGGSDCSYHAPVIRLALTPGKVFEYDVWLVLGPLEKIRARITEIHQQQQPVVR